MLFSEMWNSYWEHAKPIDKYVKCACVMCACPLFEKREQAIKVANIKTIFCITSMAEIINKNIEPNISGFGSTSSNRAEARRRTAERRSANGFFSSLHASQDNIFSHYKYIVSSQNWFSFEYLSWFAGCFHFVILTLRFLSNRRKKKANEKTFPFVIWASVALNGS